MTCTNARRGCRPVGSGNEDCGPWDLDQGMPTSLEKEEWILHSVVGLGAIVERATVQNEP